MKKLVLASVMALASISLLIAPTLRAQDSGQIEIKDPAEYNAYQQAASQSDPGAKASGLESFLTSFPQTVVKKAVLEDLTLTYQKMGDGNKAIGAATRLLQVDPNNMKGYPDLGHRQEIRLRQDQRPANVRRRCRDCAKRSYRSQDRRL